MLTIPPQADKPLVGVRATTGQGATLNERGLAGLAGTVLDYRIDLRVGYPVVVLVILTDAGRILSLFEDDVTIIPDGTKDRKSVV